MQYVRDQEADGYGRVRPVEIAMLGHQGYDIDLMTSTFL